MADYDWSDRLSINLPSSFLNTPCKVSAYVDHISVGIGTEPLFTLLHCLFLLCFGKLNTH